VVVVIVLLAICGGGAPRRSACTAMQSSPAKGRSRPSLLMGVYIVYSMLFSRKLLNLERFKEEKENIGLFS
jgi:hypothetical protein